MRTIFILVSVATMAISCSVTKATDTPGAPVTSSPSSQSGSSNTLAVPPTSGAPITAAPPAGPPPGLPSSCHYVLSQGSPVLPDPSCTPGATDPNVTQSDISSTICTKGYTSTVRPPESVTEPQKIASMALYQSAGTTSGYEYDHLIPLEIGGAPDSQLNLWPEPLSGPDGARTKDVLENKLNQLVCSGQIPLAAAQQAIANNWISAYQTYVGSGR